MKKMLDELYIGFLILITAALLLLLFVVVAIVAALGTITFVDFAFNIFTR